MDFLIREHILRCAIRDGVDVRSHMSSLLALVAAEDLVRADGEFLVEDGRLVQVGQIGHVLGLVELWRVYRFGVVDVNRLFLG
jgi:hypothetical protein